MQSTKTKLHANILPFMVEFRPGKDLAYSKVITFCDNLDHIPMVCADYESPRV